MAVPKEWFTVEEAGEYPGVSRRTIYKLCQEGRLAAYTLAEQRTRRFRKSDLDSVPSLVHVNAVGSASDTDRPLSYRTDPELAELWDNDYDAEYDDL